MSFKRIRPYRTFAIEGERDRTPIAAHELALERPVSIDLEVNLAPHPNFRGCVTFGTFRGNGNLLVEPSSAGDAHLILEPWPMGDRRRSLGRSRSRERPGHVYLVDRHGEKTATAFRRFEVEVEPGFALLLDLAPAAPWERHVWVQARGGPLAFFLGAANVLHASVRHR